MVKEIPINPDETIKSDQLKLINIPIHAYKGNLAEERLRWGDDRLREVLRYMLIIREFESMLNSFKTTGKYQDVEYSYKGPAHLSIGQEYWLPLIKYFKTKNDYHISTLYGCCSG